MKTIRNRICFFSLWIELGQKNSFTDFETTKWNAINKLTDSSLLVNDAKNAYIYDSTNFTLRYLPSFGIQFIQFFNLGNIWPLSLIDGLNVNLGIDVTERLDLLVPFTKDGQPYSKSLTTAGLIFPFNNKKGNRVVNIEPFFSLPAYTEPKREQDPFVGIKLSVPLFSKDDSGD